MPTFYLIRHGQTEFNEAGRMQGQIDSNLTELGKDQAAASSDEIKEVNFNYCYHSPLGRTTETAQILTRHHNDLELTPDEDLIEIGFGEWEGTYHKRADHAEINDDSSEEEVALHHFWFAPHIFTGAPGGGEDYAELTARIFTGIEKLQKKHADGETILLVSHCAAIRSFLNKCIGREIKDFWEYPKTAPASISIVKWNKGEAPEVIKYSGYDMSAVNN